ncbi:interleukin-1 receptor accessory protein [Chanos chanos]|uniref:Interleukin-1 receptor accessory protein n=1 Tax=Chanos chanos TaxID=29144 RepID=A0A6J2VKX7_CHACN|nr:interleukin-1 receptor accessory protein [Chanos chanos]
MVGVGRSVSPVTPSGTKSVLQCEDWGVASQGSVRVLDGEAGWLRCPLFSYSTVYIYSSAQSSGLNLFWYRLSPGQELEQPINLQLPTYHKDREWLWFQPANAHDAGQYTCMLRNISSCAKIAVHLDVVSRERTETGECVPVSAVPPQNVTIPLQEEGTLTCPDLSTITLPSNTYRVSWYHRCGPVVLHSSLRREVRNNDLVIHAMMAVFEGLYTCVVSYENNGRTLNFSRIINVKAVSSSKLPKIPEILNLDKDNIFTVKLGDEVVLKCQVLLPYLDSEGESQVWWTIDGKKVEELSDSRFTTSTRELLNSYGNREMECELKVADFSSGDLSREFNCSVRNSRGFDSRRANLKKEAYIPSLELGCGLGVTLFLMLLMFILYHVFWLELLLLYRSWFGTDERTTDDKEYDVYISYARNSEEEQFVLLTLRTVLENEFGYSVCIFDRDGLPGGTITDETLSFVGRSRRLIVVVSPSWVVRGTQALLELKAGLDRMVWGGNLRIILVQYKPVQKAYWVKELRRARLALTLIRWKGEKSSALSSRFWKRLQVELPVHRVRELRDRDHCAAVPLHNVTDAVFRCMQRSRRVLVVLSPDYVTDKSLSLLELHVCLYLRNLQTQTHIVTVRYRCVPGPCAEVQLLRQNSTLIRWREQRSKRAGSRFWKLLRLSLPVRPLALGRRLIDSTSSHSDLSAVAHRAQQGGAAHCNTCKGQDKGSGDYRGHRSRAGRKQLPGQQQSHSCRLCVSFTEHQGVMGVVLGGATRPQWQTHVHQPAANGMAPLYAMTSDPSEGITTNHCPCDQSSDKCTNQHSAGSQSAATDLAEIPQ